MLLLWFFKAPKITQKGTYYHSKIAVTDESVAPQDFKVSIFCPLARHPPLPINSVLRIRGIKVSAGSRGSSKIGINQERPRKASESIILLKELLQLMLLSKLIQIRLFIWFFSQTESNVFVAVHRNSDPRSGAKFSGGRFS